MWTKGGHPAPLILTEREWRESADAFPIEYEDMRDAHRLLAGRDPWPGVRVERDHVRRQARGRRSGPAGGGVSRRGGADGGVCERASLTGIALVIVFPTLKGGLGGERAP